MNIQAKNNYSFLFNNLGSGSGTANLNFMADYASIKNGSYGKLMKAYYSKEPSKAVKQAVSKNTVSKESAKSLTEVQSSTDKLKESADKLLIKGEKSVFNGETLTEEAYKAVSDFVTDYNSVINASKAASNSTIAERTTSMSYATNSNKALLTKAGVTINSDNTLTLDKTKFMAADVNTAKNLFNTTGAFAYRTSAQASLINFAADQAVSKANTYTTNGTYQRNLSTGNIFDSLF